MDEIWMFDWIYLVYFLPFLTATGPCFATAGGDLDMQIRLRAKHSLTTQMWNQACYRNEDRTGWQNAPKTISTVTFIRD